MNLNKLFETQRILDIRIEKEHPRGEGEYRLSKKILSLLVELAECANEWRGFKFWSTNQNPNTAKPVTTFYGSRNGETTNPLLEEYVDCLHFILSIGLELEFEYIVECIRIPQENTTDAFLDLFEAISILDMDRTPFDYDLVFDRFIVLGEMLGFTWEQIEQAYYDKNAINHTRQDTGY
ncbi:dUTP diphosphatase [Psychrobacillus psychrodurans]|uniref:dUTP diphosphatase n=1 Tax=Psychrobacillus psychrodurans TaxID=126157 RepID=UPI0008EC0961|nr:dUTP diphosphatase [Psychrobacillus psychrodurans]MCZ8541978.1 dUTP diphosphatase [Psychrobacillus psychrodurans]SFN13832.1 Dimeric dUTPase, all-alpha-NTP-PPase (MazG) superfamily [Psychrobacillus psychrodurans]